MLDGDLVPGLRHTQPAEQLLQPLRGHEGVREEVGPPGDVIQGGCDDDQEAEEEGAGDRHQGLGLLSVMDEVVEYEDTDTHLRRRLA